MSIFRSFILNFKAQRTGHMLLPAGFCVPVKDSPQSTSGEQMPPIPILVPFNSTYLTRKNSKSQAVTTVIQTIHIDNKFIDMKEEEKY